MFRKILDKLRWRGPKGVYLGQVAVVPESTFIRLIDQMVDIPFAVDTDAELRSYLADWLAIPPIPDTGVTDRDLAIDVYVCGYRTGQGLFGNIFGVPAVVFWRPKMELRARLYNAQSRQVIENFIVTRKMPWRIFCKRLFSFRHLVMGWRLASPTDMEALLGETLILLMKKIRQRI